MKWIIKNPAPPQKDGRQKCWGDYHFGKCLAKYLERCNQIVEIDYYNRWNKNRKSDIVIVLRGLYPYNPQKNVFNIMWNISHPERITLKEYEKYDIVFIASKSYAKYLKPRIKTPVYTLLQCTDPEEFYVDKELDSKRKDIIFVGNTRGVKRPAIFWAVRSKLPIKIWGLGWDKWISKKYIQGNYYPNSKLRQLYSKSKVTLNDHLTGMKRMGFINNRIFDALACGLPIISDYNKELYELFPEGILYYRNKKEFLQCIEKIDNSYIEIKKKINDLVPVVKKNHSFEARVKFMLKIIDKHIK